MNRLRVCTLLFVAFSFALAPSALTGQVIPVHANPMLQMAEGPVPWPKPVPSQSSRLDGPVPWPKPVPGIQQTKG